LHAPDEPAAGRLEDRLEVWEDLLRLLLDPAGNRDVAGLQAELARDEDEAPRCDRLRVRRSLKRRRSRLGAHDLLVAHRRASSLSHASASAAPRALKIASSTWPLSVPSRSRMWRTSPAFSASTSKNRRATSVPSPPMRARVTTTFVTRSGSSLVSSTTWAIASADVSAPAP